VIMSDNGVVTLQSRFSVRETVDRLGQKVTSLGLIVFARIDHMAGAAQAGAELLIFLNPKGGTPLMQDRQIAGIDLPVKALAYEDTDGKTWLAYNDAVWIATRHGLGAKSADAVKAIAAGMAMVTRYAAEG